MAVVINTNSAATIAANNLDASTKMLQKSLNRLSSGTKIISGADDAGGVAVAARLTAASSRTGIALGNIGSALSFLQQQDSALKTGAKVVQRMNELQILYRDTTKSSTDRNQYDTEFTKLRTQYRDGVRNATYNSISLLQGSLSVTVNEGLATYDLADLSGDVRDAVAGGWAITDGGTYASITGTKGFVTNSGVGTAENLVFSVGGRADQTVVIAANSTMSSIVSTINGSGVGVTASLTADGFLKIVGNNQSESLAIKAASGANICTALGITKSDTAVNATGQTDNTLAEIQKLATARAKNGADQSALQYYSELATATKTNFESAVGRIMDVDVAQESTQLARWSTLVQAGTAMMAQANGSTVSALSLLKG